MPRSDDKDCFMDASRAQEHDKSRQPMAERSSTHPIPEDEPDYDDLDGFLIEVETNYAQPQLISLNWNTDVFIALYWCCILISFTVDNKFIPLL